MMAFSKISKHLSSAAYFLVIKTFRKFIATFVQRDLKWFTWRKVKHCFERQFEKI